MREPVLILVVDDVPDNVDILQMRLESQGYEVVTAGDGVEALEKTRELLPDLILLDIMMPKMDGIETVKRLKADASLPFIPVILVTAKADDSDRVCGVVFRKEVLLSNAGKRIRGGVATLLGWIARREGNVV